MNHSIVPSQVFQKKKKNSTSNITVKSTKVLQTYDCIQYI